MRDIDRHEVLFLALLFHDIGKGHGEGHSGRGADMVRDIAARLPLNQDEVAQWEFLVRQHLLMSHLAQHRDTQDPRLLAEFADLCGKSVAVIRASSEASAIDEINKEQCQSDPIQSVILPDGNAAILAVKSGQADYFLTSRPVAAYTINSAGGSGLELFELKDLPSSYGTPPDYPEVFPNGMAFRKGDTEFRDAVRGALLALIDDGTYAALLEKYGISDISYTAATINGEKPKQ